MKVVRIVVFIVLLALFIGLIYLLIITYKDYKANQDYISFVTDSANGYIEEVETTNNVLNQLTYNEEEMDVTTLENRLSVMEQKYNEINNERMQKAVPSNGDVLDSNFTLFLDKAKSLNDSLRSLIDSIENLEEKEVFQVKFDAYTEASSSLQTQSEILGTELNNFMSDYGKFDLDSLRNGFKSN